MSDIRMVRMTSEFMVTLATRDIDGNRLSVDWGDPDQDGFYAPTISVDFEDNPITDLLEALEELLHKQSHNINSYAIVGHDDSGHPVNALGMARINARKAIAKAKEPE